MTNYRAFDRFHNALRILLNIDQPEFAAALAGKTDLDDEAIGLHWKTFRANPHRWFIAVPTVCARAVWDIVEQRQ